MGSGNGFGDINRVWMEVKRFTINAIPLGGFVRILGENNESAEHPGSFINKGFWPRFLTLIAGVVMNVILAGLFICRLWHWLAGSGN